MWKLNFFLLATVVSAQPPVTLSASVYPGVIWRGLPSIINLALTSTGTDESVTIEEGEIVVQIINSNGERVDWPWEAIDRIAFPLTLAPLHSSTEVYVLSPEATAQLPEGEYMLQANFAGSAARAFGFRVARQPGKWEPEDDLSRIRLLSRYAFYKDDKETAIAVLEEGVERLPDDPWLIADLAAAEDAAGLRSRAILTIGRALAAYREQFPDAGHPPLELYRLRNQIAAQLFELEELP